MLRKYPAIFLLPFIIFGIVLADWLRIPAWILFSVILLSAVAGITGYLKQKTWAIIFLSLSLLFFAAFHFAIRYYDTGLSHVINYIDGKTTYNIYGTVSDWPDLKTNRTEIKLEVDSLRLDKAYYVTGSVMVRITDTTTLFQRGDRLALRGRIYPMVGSRLATGFDYRRYLNFKDVFGIVDLPTPLGIRLLRGSEYSFYNIITTLRTMIRESVQDNLSATCAALASGFLIGETRDIPPEIYRWFKDSGTLHLLAVSGSNVALIILFVIVLLRPFAFSRKKRTVILLGAVLVFNLLAYGEPSVMRASVMASLVLIASWMERRYDLNHIIAVAACIILLYEPGQLYDVGFQLSFVIAWGLIFTVPKVTPLFERYHKKKWYNWLVYPMIISLTAQMFSIGLIGLYFSRIPMASPIANLIIVPQVSVAVFGILILLILDLILPFLGMLFGVILNLWLQGIIVTVNFFGSAEALVWETSNWSWYGVILFYAVLVLAVKAIDSRVFRRALIIVLSLLVVMFSLIKLFTMMFGEKIDCRLHMFKIPSGIAVVVNDGLSSDLIITDLKDKDYPIEEKILLPNLSRTDYGSVDRIYILGCEYGAIDDLVRLAVKEDIEQIYLNSSLLNSFSDWIDNSEISLNTELIEMSESETNNIDEVYSLNRSVLTLNLSPNKISVCAQLSDTKFNLNQSDNNILILGRSWKLTVDEMLSLYRSGFNRIVCANIDQEIITSDTTIMNWVESEMIIDLSSRQSYYFNLFH